MFKRILIANRGEIARRIIRATKKLGIESVAVFSEADREAPYVKEADLAVCIGPARAAESYLDARAILQAALQTESQAIHPGYGFLSENALFAQMVKQTRLAWIGPPPAVIRLMGEKSPAKAAAKAAGLPLIPGSDGLLESAEQAAQIAKQVGYPVLLKADAGGGGRGMRRANSKAELIAAYDEKYLVGGRHIEFQVLADRWGNAVHLFERECSVQRRHQKLLEESPSVALSEKQRLEVGNKVAAASAAIGYEGAGTVEFLQDEKSGELYFIEMNTRLQVEHPVTEETTGIDLVEAQIRIAAGERLWFTQESLRLNGHSIEVRLNAEDPDRGFAPSPGVINKLSAPEGPMGEGRVRFDAAVVEGSRVSPHYDSMIGKLITWAPDRTKAIALMVQALTALELEGVKSTRGLQQDILAAEDFRAGNLRVGVVPGRPDLSSKEG
jgi:acetyl-CoA carboxylase biotin carboxylase subunit